MKKYTIVTGLTTLALLASACSPWNNKPNPDATTSAMMEQLASSQTELAELQPTTTVRPTEEPIDMVQTARAEATRLVADAKTEAAHPSATPEAPQATSTAAPSPTPVASPTPALKNAVEPYTVVMTETVNGWTFQWTDVAMKIRPVEGNSFYDWAKTAYPEIWELVPVNWKTAPNVPNPLEPRFVVRNGNEVPDGVQIPDEGERNFCQVLEGQMCTNVVAVGHYMMFTGDGSINGLWNAVPGEGNALSIWNVGNDDARFDGTFLQGWRLTGLYWNGNTLPIAIVGTHGHASYNMLNLGGSVGEDAAFPSNPGGNCSQHDGCPVVNHTAVITSGNAPMLIMTNKVTKP